MTRAKAAKVLCKAARDRNPKKFRSVGRTDEQILNHQTDLELLRRVAAGSVTTTAELRMDLRRLARDNLLLCGFGIGARAVILPRGQRVLAIDRGEMAATRDE